MTIGGITVDVEWLRVDSDQIAAVKQVVAKVAMSSVCLLYRAEQKRVSRVR